MVQAFLRREDEYVRKRVMVMEAPGKRRRGRPKRRWFDNLRNDLSERELSGEEVLININDMNGKLMNSYSDLILMV